MKKVLPTSFFNRPAPVVAEDLLGKYVVRRFDGCEKALVIVETEAYEGIEDLASHASKGRTARTEVMFGPPGVFYIYLIYGMHYMLNVVTNRRDEPSAVLIRSVGEISGPGRLTKILSITKEFNALAATQESELWFEDRGDIVQKTNIVKSPRIGVDYAGDIWSKKLFRFVYTKN